MPVPAAGAQVRAAERMPVSLTVEYRVEGKREHHAATATDLSAGGLRLCSHHDLLAGSMLCLDFTLPQEFLSLLTVEREISQQMTPGDPAQSVAVRPAGFGPMSIRAKVLTNFFELASATFAYGVAFVDVDRKTQQELERFVELWQRAATRTEDTCGEGPKNGED